MRRMTIRLVITGLLLVLPARAEEGQGCAGLLDEADLLAPTLTRVAKYGSTYVLVYSDRFAEGIDSLDSPVIGGLRLGVYQGSPATAAAAQLAPKEVLAYTFDPAAAGQLVEDILAGTIDGGVLWAPLAGLAAYELDFDYELSLLTAGNPGPVPAAFAGAAPTAGRAGCATEVAGQLEGYGVVPAEKLVQLDIRDFLHLPAPERDLAAARRGEPLYAEHCAKCHGPHAVAAQDALAPVDILTSVARFSYPGFLYISLNGRSQNGMPGFNGSLGREEIELIFQYARERAHGTLGVPEEAGTAGGAE